MNVENCWILPGGTDRRLWWGYLRRRTTGSVCQVAFDANYVLKREEERGDIIGFFHTHPCGAYPSNRDDATMHQWVDCFGKPLVCVIQGTDTTRVWIYFDGDNPPVEAKTFKVFGGLIVGIMPRNPVDTPLMEAEVVRGEGFEMRSACAPVSLDSDIPGHNDYVEGLL